MRAKILNASAGSGKTYQLAYQYVREVIEQPTIYRNILAVTFTNKATEEMKNRILQEIHALAEGQGAYLDRLGLELSLTREQIRRRAAEARSRILHDYSRFTVLTIDTFFQRILRAFIKELNLDLNYNIELETAPILSAGADALIEEITTNRELLQWITRFVEERIEEGDRWDIRDGILSLGNELFKENNRENILHMRSREELQQIIERATAAVKQSQNRMQERAKEAVAIIASAGASIEDFPYKKQGFASWFYHLAAGNICGYGARAAKAADEDSAWGKPKTLAQELRPTLQPIMQELIALYDRNLRHWNTTALMRETFRSFALLGDLLKQVNEQCNKQQLRLLSETKHLLADFVAKNDAPFIYEKVGNRFERFMIDEFQDTSVAEWRNMLPLLQNAMASSEECSVFIVGDVKQSIYRWRGGDWRLLQHSAKQMLGDESVAVE
ncbi:MAG: UvrD-helicase domain-containing protein, partial [Alistipes sp.]|nr:UvrD-helicase domain-containing protein [Alistipes sp.]